MLHKSPSIAFASFETEAYNGLMRHKQSLLELELGRQKKLSIGYSRVVRKQQ